MKKLMFAVFALALLAYAAPAAQAKAWTFLGAAHVDGQHDHDNIEVGRFAGRYRALRIRVNNAPIEFDHIVVHYGNGQAETLRMHNVIPAGGHSSAIALQGDRVVQSFELWYGKARPFSRRPELSLFGLK